MGCGRVFDARALCREIGAAAWKGLGSRQDVVGGKAAGLTDGARGVWW